MISYNRFTELLHNLFLKPLFIESFGFKPNWSTNINDYDLLFNSNYSTRCANGKCIWWHEEPLNLQDLNILKYYSLHFYYNNPHCFDDGADVGNPGQTDNIHDVNFQIFANSEKSNLKKAWFKKYPYLDWYFFFHGFAALDWFRDYKYLDYQTIELSKVFISLNHLIDKNRSYRLNLIAQIKKHGLEKHGYISAPLLNQTLIKQELYNSNSRLSVDAKKDIFNYLLPSAQPLILDDCTDYSSASSRIIDTEFSHGALFHLVTETIFYDEKLHLTEKIFKPIVCKRPFILVGAVNNLQYFKTYGFKTFDRWIDESYDTEPDYDKRINLIITEIKKLCALSLDELKKMHLEMQEILEFNHKHFYGNFKEIIVDELIDNFKKCVFNYNKDLSERYQLPEKNINYDKIKKIIMR